MPPPGHRKKPFSTKQKKRQLQEKRDRRRDDHDDSGESSNRVRNRGRGQGPAPRGTRGRCPFVGSDQSREHTESSDQSGVDDLDVLNIHQHTLKGDKAYDPNRYRLHFINETREAIEQRKEQARQPIECVDESSLEWSIEGVYESHSSLDMPKRPTWSYGMSKNVLETKEETYFKGYVDSLMEKHDEELSYFELNLETWRQLWRVIEMADIVLLIADIRYPALNFSPALYHHVTAELHKPLLLVLNKIDLAPASVVTAWKHYFMERFPELHIVLFTSFPRDADIDQCSRRGVMKKRPRRRISTAVGPRELLRVCESIVQDKVDMCSWHEKMDQDMEFDAESDDMAPAHEVNIEDLDTSYSQNERYKDGILTIGCCGYPNVGKSSLINGLMGKKVVSVSRTPGHTKHFQTIFLTPTVRLCDSPGLVFPSLLPKPMQILSGIYPIAQVREPYTAVGFLAQRIPIIDILQLKHPESSTHRRPDLPDTKEYSWSAMDVCDAWAAQRGFLTAKAARLDSYRAANSLLRLTMEGRVILCTRPAGYTAKKGYWESHPETTDIAVLQTIHRQQLCNADSASSSDNEPDEEGHSSSAQGDDEGPHIFNANPFSLLSGSDE